MPNISDTHVVLHNFINSFLNYGSGRTLKHSGQTRFDINFNEIIYKFINGYNEIDVKTVFNCPCALNVNSNGVYRPLKITGTKCNNSEPGAIYVTIE